MWEILGGDASPSALPRALSLLGNLIPDGDYPQSSDAPNGAPPLGGACYACSAFFSPVADRCPGCGSLSTLRLPGPHPDLADTLRHPRDCRSPSVAAWAGP